MADDSARLGRELSDAVVLFHEAIGQRRGLTAVDHKALGIITRSGPLTAGRLAQLTGLTPGAVTGLVDRLVRAGCVRREPDPADRRRLLVSAAAGPPDDAVLADVFAILGREMGEFTSGLDERQVEAVVAWLRKMIDVLQAQTRRLSEADERALRAPEAAGR